MTGISEEEIRSHCPHCDSASYAFTYPLFETDNFRVVCDVHPLEEGHVLIIPKDHIECIASYPPKEYEEFLTIYDRLCKFITKAYGSVATFEHGKFGQTVFHSHVHLLPFTGSTTDIVPEGENMLRTIDDLSQLKDFLKKNGGYLFFSINDTKFVVNTSLTAPRFFRDRFGKALHRPERGNWKAMHENPRLMEQGKKENITTQQKWKVYTAYNE